MTSQDRVREGGVGLPKVNKFVYIYRRFVLIWKQNVFAGPNRFQVCSAYTCVVSVCERPPSRPPGEERGGGGCCLDQSAADSLTHKRTCYTLLAEPQGEQNDTELLAGLSVTACRTRWSPVCRGADPGT